MSQEKSYELHVTVNPADYDYFSHICQILGMKALLIENDKGVHNRQLLCSFRNTAESQINSQLNRLEHYCLAYEVPILRKKIEVKFDPRHPEVKYHEMHIKLEIPRVMEPILINFCAEYQLALSHRITEEDNPELVKYYITLRDYKELKDPATVFTGVHNRVKARFEPYYLGWTMETVILDQDPGNIDQGWIDHP